MDSQTGSPWTAHDVLEIATRQKQVLWLIVASLVASFIPFATLVTGGISIYVASKFARSLRRSPWLYLAMCFIPLVGLVALARLNGAANQVLTSQGHKVGFMGVAAQDLEQMRSLAGQAARGPAPASVPTVLRGIAVTVGVAAVMYGGAQGVAYWREQADDELAVNAAITLVSQRLKAPSTAQWSRQDVVAREPPYYVVHLGVEAQNSFGAYLHSEYLVAIELADDEQFRYKPYAAVNELEPGELNGYEVELMKQLNEWPSTQEKPAQAEEPSITNERLTAPGGVTCESSEADILRRVRGAKRNEYYPAHADAPPLVVDSVDDAERKQTRIFLANGYFERAEVSWNSRFGQKNWEADAAPALEAVEEAGGSWGFKAMWTLAILSRLRTQLGEGVLRYERFAKSGIVHNTWRSRDMEIEFSSAELDQGAMTGVASVTYRCLSPASAPAQAEAQGPTDTIVKTALAAEQDAPRAPAALEPAAAADEESDTPTAEEQKPDGDEALMDRARELVAEWLKAQNQGDYQTYARLYAADFVGEKRSGDRAYSFDRTGWLGDREKMFRRPMVVGMEGESISVAEGKVFLEFVQTFSQGTFRDRGRKRIALVYEGDALRIQREAMLESVVTGEPDEPVEAAPVACDSATECNGKGMRRYKSGKYDEALVHFLAAHRLDPAHALSAYNAACVYALQANAPEAVAMLRRVEQSGHAEAQEIAAKARVDRDFDAIRSTREFRTWERTRDEQPSQPASPPAAHDAEGATTSNGAPSASYTTPAGRVIIAAPPPTPQR